MRKQKLGFQRTGHGSPWFNLFYKQPQIGEVPSPRYFRSIRLSELAIASSARLKDLVGALPIWVELVGAVYSAYRVLPQDEVSWLVLYSLYFGVVIASELAFILSHSNSSFLAPDFKHVQVAPQLFLVGCCHEVLCSG